MYIAPNSTHESGNITAQVPLWGNSKSAAHQKTPKNGIRWLL